jgi:hypothetical protein
METFALAEIDGQIGQLLPLGTIEPCFDFRRLDTPTKAQ